MGEFFWVWFIDFMLEGKGLLGYTSLFPPNEYKSNDEMMPEYFQKFKTKMSFIIRFSRAW